MNELTREEKKINLENFYSEANLDKNKILEANKYLDQKTNELKNDSYSCICCFCGNSTSKLCDHSCCKIGIKCENFILLEEKTKKLKIEKIKT